MSPTYRISAISSKVIVWEDRQTDWWFDKPTFISRKYAKKDNMLMCKSDTETELLHMTTIFGGFSLYEWQICAYSLRSKWSGVLILFENASTFWVSAQYGEHSQVTKSYQPTIQCATSKASMQVSGVLAVQVWLIVALKVTHPATVHWIVFLVNVPAETTGPTLNQESAANSSSLAGAAKNAFRLTGSLYGVAYYRWTIKLHFPFSRC